MTVGYLNLVGISFRFLGPIVVLLASSFGEPIKASFGCAAMSPTQAPALEAQFQALPPLDIDRRDDSGGRGDYLLESSEFTARVGRSGDRIVLDNGLVRRVWSWNPNGACVAFENLMTGASMLRSVRPEARVTCDGRGFDVGGLLGQPNHAYLTDAWLEQMTADPKALQLVGFEVGVPLERMAWKRVRHAAPGVQWPPAGVRLRMDYFHPDETFQVSVHYELYDGMPVFSKWLSVNNQGEEPLSVDRFVAEELAVVEQANWVEHRDGVALPEPDYLHVQTDMAFGGFNAANANRHTVRWQPDPLYSTQVNWARQQPCLLTVGPTYGPEQIVEPGASFESFRAFELVYDSSERERQGLAQRRMLRTIAPWVTENPLMHHLLASDPALVRQAIDQAAEVGFEMLILSFGSGFNMESEDPEYIEEWRRVADYAHERGIELGGYSLLSSRRIGDGQDIVSPEGQKPTHGNCPALTSEWGQAYYAKLYSFMERTGFDLLEHDGPYPGDVDVTPRPPLQKGEADSRWVQWSIAADFYRWCRGRGIYLNTPDFYYLVGSNKCGMGYREVNWSLPREQQLIHTRQNIYDGTWSKTPSMGWMFVPLSEYHGGGAAATIEPLDQHRDHYRGMLRSNLGLGVQACYRGPRLFDSDATRDMLKAEVQWFLKYRDILESDVVHGRRADGRHLDWMLHVNPELETKGLLCVYNPLDREQTERINVNLYYTGLAGEVQLARGQRTEDGSFQEGPVQRQVLNPQGEFGLSLSVPAGGMAWFVVR